MQMAKHRKINMAVFQSEPFRRLNDAGRLEYLRRMVYPNPAADPAFRWGALAGALMAASAALVLAVIL